MLGEAARNKELMELQDLDSRVQKFVEFSRQALQEEQQKLMQPIQEKVMKAYRNRGKGKGPEPTYSTSRLCSISARTL